MSRYYCLVYLIYQPVSFSRGDDNQPSQIYNIALPCSYLDQHPLKFENGTTIPKLATGESPRVLPRSAEGRHRKNDVDSTPVSIICRFTCRFQLERGPLISTCWRHSTWNRHRFDIVVFFFLTGSLMLSLQVCCCLKDCGGICKAESWCPLRWKNATPCTQPSPRDGIAART